MGVNLGYAQMTELLGRVEADESIDGIHVVNKSRRQFATTNASGEFKIQAMAKDTLVISSVQYELVSLIVSEEDIALEKLTVRLKSKVNELDEVVVGKILTGDLSSDILNSDAKPDINFYDVGIPGYTGKKKTANEKRLQEASDMNPTMGGSLGGVGMSVSAIALINAITGRTKRLKHIVKLERDEALMYGLKARLSKSFFDENPMADNLKMDFLYFCSEDDNFMARCGTSDLEAIEFMKEKYEQYQKNRTSKE